jgi:peptide/nickel transport system substrate-binding protein
LTVVVNFAEVYAPYLRLFSYILPQAAGDPAALDTWEYNRAPFGTGPWVLKDWQSGNFIEFDRNPNFREEGKPYLDKLIVRILPSREVGLQLLGTGEIQALWDITEADFPALDALKEQGVTYAGAQTGENELLLFNFADPAVDAPADASANPHPILNDLAVRQAIQYAINKQELVDTLLYGNVNVGTTVLPNGAFACPQPASEFSVEKANALLDEAGWTTGADGIREKDGQKLELKITTTSGNLLREQTQQVLVEMLKAAGVSLIIENVPSDVLFAGWDADGLRKHGQFDILLYTTGPFLDPDSHLFSNYHSISIPTAENEGSGSNYSRYVNADVDAAIDEAASITDVEQRRALYCTVAEQINKDLPRLFLYERLLLTAYNDKLQNFKVSPGPSDFTFGSENWWLTP